MRVKQGHIKAILMASVAFAATSGGAFAATSAEQIAQMQKMIEAQAAQLEMMRKELEAMKGQVSDNSAKVEQARTAPPLTVGGGSDRVSLSISGQMNQAMNLVDDGDSTDVYFIDNDASNSRLSVNADINFENGATGGLYFETAFSPNNSYNVSQEKESEGDFTQIRHVEVFYRDDSMGQVAFGRGQMASDDVSEYDFSATGLIGYANYADPVGGMYFTDEDGLTGITVGGAYNDIDGGRRNRISYMTPMFSGFQVHGAYGSDDNWDVALKYGYDYNNWSGVDLGGISLLGGVAISDDNEDNADLRYNGSLSILHNDSGVSVALSAGTIDTDGKDPYSLYGKLAWDTNIYDFGGTAFSIDYGYSKNITSSYLGDGALEGDKGQSVGFAVVQNVADYGIDFYGQARWYSLDNAAGNPDYDDIWALTAGTRIKF